MTEADECTCPTCLKTITGLPADLSTLAREIHADNVFAGWWKRTAHNLGTADQYYTTDARNTGELLALVHSEISEADEGYVDNLRDDKLPHRPMAEVELADTALRVLDMLGFWMGAGVMMDWAAQCQAMSPGATFADRIRYMHRLTTEALEGFRKGNAVRGCRSLVALLSLISMTAIVMGYDLTGAIAEKRAFNRTRADHQLAARAAAGGKQF